MGFSCFNALKMNPELEPVDRSGGEENRSAAGGASHLKCPFVCIPFARHHGPPALPHAAALGDPSEGLSPTVDPVERRASGHQWRGLDLGGHLAANRAIDTLDVRRPDHLPCSRGLGFGCGAAAGADDGVTRPV